MSSVDVKKKIKLKDAFHTENLDPTSSVKKILSHLSVKNPKAYAFYVKVMGIREKNAADIHWDMVGHTIGHFPADYDGSSPSDFFEEFPYRSGLPVFITPINHIGVKDPVTRILRTKKNWNTAVSGLFKRPDYLVKRYKKINEEVVKCPSRLIEATACLQSEPDRAFRCPYNWHYAGHGNLHYLTVCGAPYVLHSQLTRCYLSPFSKEDLKIDYDKSAHFECGEENYILETIYSDSRLVVLRTEKRLFILRIDMIEQNATFHRVKELASPLPYTSIAFDGHHKNILYVTSLDAVLTIVNVDRMTKKTVQLCNSKGQLNNWSMVRHSSRTEYVHVTRNTISVYDKRTHMKRVTWSDLNLYSSIKCDEISSVLVCEGTPHVYVGTTHHLFRLDVGQDIPKVLQRWTHGMQIPPTYITGHRFEGDRELLCLSSQWCEDMCLVATDVATVKPLKPQLSTVTMPYRPPSIKTTLTEARLKSLCTDLYNAIDARLYTAISGGAIVEKDEKYVVLMQNSLGDMMCHTLYPRHLQHVMDSDSPQKLHEWSRAYKSEKKDFSISDTVDVADLWTKLKKIPDEFELFDENENDNFSETEMLDTIKAIDPSILEAWGISPDVEQESRESIEE